MATLALQGEHRSGLRVLGAVLDVIDAHRFIGSGLRDECPVRLLHHQRRPTVVVAGFPDDEVTLGRGHRRQEPPPNAFSSAGVAISMWAGFDSQTHVARHGHSSVWSPAASC